MDNNNIKDGKAKCTTTTKNDVKCKNGAEVERGQWENQMEFLLAVSVCTLLRKEK